MVLLKTERFFPAVGRKFDVVEKRSKRKYTAGAPFTCRKIRKYSNNHRIIEAVDSNNNVREFGSWIFLFFKTGRDDE